MTLPGVFGVFFYRSANPKTLQLLNTFLPVPIEGLTKDFASGATAEEVCARTIRTLRDVGVKHFYISNLPIGRAPGVLRAKAPPHRTPPVCSRADRAHAAH